MIPVSVLLMNLCTGTSSELKLYAASFTVSAVLSSTQVFIMNGSDGNKTKMLRPRL